MSVMDSVNKYRHGVLIGNFVEDKFGTDLNQRGPEADALKKTSMKSVHDIDHSLYKKHEVIANKEGSTNNFYQTSKHYDQSYYKKPENQTSNEIFYRQQVGNHIPILANNPKKEEKQNAEKKLYDETRYYLSNKFSSPYQASGNTLQSTFPVQDRESLRETGNIYDIKDQQIPDILTGDIWKHAQQKPDEEVYAPTRDRNEPTTKITANGASKSINPYGATTIIKPQLQKYDHQMYKRYVLANDKGEQRDVLLGHGIQLDQFHRRQLATSYDLSYNQKIEPQTQINSFYNVDPAQTAKKYHRETLYEKNYQDKVPEYGTKKLLGQQKLGRPYDPYTKTYDSNHLKHEYLRK